jgi:hypothetical protein
LPAAGALVSPEAAAAVTGISLRSVFRCLEAGLIHYREADDGKVLICFSSLAVHFGSRRLADRRQRADAGN